MADQLLEQKLRHMPAAGATVVVTGNLGCLAHMSNGLRARGMTVCLAHPITLLAEVCRNGKKKKRIRRCAL